MSVGVTREVYEGLEAVRESGKTNLFDIFAVQKIAADMGYYDTVKWLEDQITRLSPDHARTKSGSEYPKGIFNGFHIIGEEDE